MILPYDLHEDLLTVEQAAELARVSPEVIRQWIHREHLRVAWRDPYDRDRPRLRGIDVLRAEAKTRSRAARVWPATRRRDACLT